MAAPPTAAPDRQQGSEAEQRSTWGSDADWLGQQGGDAVATSSAATNQATGNTPASSGAATVQPAQRSRQQPDQRGSGEKQLHKQLRLAELQLVGFLMPWANEQPAAVYADIAGAAAAELDRWRCLVPTLISLRTHQAGLSALQYAFRRTLASCAPFCHGVR